MGPPPSFETAASPPPRGMRAETSPPIAVADRIDHGNALFFIATGGKLKPFPTRMSSSMTTPSIADRRSTFRGLHRSGCFVIPNPWDVGSSRYLQHLGFKSLATTSAGFAFSQG